MDMNLVLTDVPVPSMAVGTMYFGTAVPVGEAHQVLDVAYEQGARFWDTANNYAFWAEDGTGMSPSSACPRDLGQCFDVEEGEPDVGRHCGADQRPNQAGDDHVWRRTGISTARRLQLRGDLERDVWPGRHRCRARRRSAAGP